MIISERHELATANFLVTITYRDAVMQQGWLACIGRYEWGNPFGGKGADKFALSDDGNTMTMHTYMYIRDLEREHSYK